MMAAFSLALLFQNLWTGFFAAFIAATVWLWLLDMRRVSRLQDPGKRKIVRAMFVFLVSALLGVSVMDYKRSVNHKAQLTDIRTTIIHSVSRIEIENSLQLALRHFYSLPSEEQTSIADAFRDLFSDRLNEDGSWIPDIPDDGDMQFRYAIVSPDSIVLTVSTNFTRGKDPQFINTNQQTGLYQAKAVLTKRGVQHVREN